jgi:hypothetical protein
MFYITLSNTLPFCSVATCVVLQLSAEPVIMTCFSKRCQTLLFFLHYLLGLPPWLQAAAISEDHDYSMLRESVNRPSA